MDFNVTFPGLGLAFTIHRVAFSIGAFSVYWYGILIALGMVLAMAFAFHYADDFGINSDRLIDVIFIGTIMSVVCARIAYVSMAPFTYRSIWEMMDIRLGGIAIYGAVLGAFVFGGLAAKWRKIPILPLFDLVSIGFFIGQAVGRWGNFVNQEAFGTNTTLPWGMYSEGTRDYLTGAKAALAAEGVAVDPSLPVHPTFLYESIWCLLGFLLLFFLLKKRRFHGQMFLTYVIWYGLGRYWIEGLRTDSLLITNTTLRFSQMVALVSVATAVVLMVYALQKCRGKVLMVPLAVGDLKKQKAVGALFAVEQLPARTPHSEFARATAAMNERLAELVPGTVPADAAEDVEPVADDAGVQTGEKGGEPTAEAAGKTEEEPAAKAQDAAPAPAEKAANEETPKTEGNV